MAAARVGGSPNRVVVLLSSAALLASVFLGGCTGGPEPTPILPSPPPPTATARTTATAPPSFSLHELQAMVELYSAEMLQEGAPAVLIEAKVGREEWSHAAGVRSRDGGVPVQLSDPVPVGGITQTMVAVSVLKLVDEGRLALDEPISRHLPELEGLLHPPKPLSVRQLLGHTSGMPDYYAPLLESAPLRQVLTTPISPEQRLAVAGTVPWQQREPLEFSYSRSDYVALGLLVERLRGMPLAEVLTADIVEPLGLRSTAMIGDGPAPVNLVHGYTMADGGLVDVAYSALQRGSASGGMISTVEDINTFYAALLRGELLSPASVIEMKGRIYAEYGLGLDQWNDRCTNGFYYGHSGDIPGYGTIAISSADGNRQLAMSVAYPPSPLPARSHAIVLEMTVLAQRALNASCSFQFWRTPTGD
ncbi:serine hydrolase domain-containing protein [Arthrobacter cavernae]|uniref:Beta-lactamase family protein n=1 Tax=Arthrobacter cavernae TaxID=2817681 RepID=A0A939KKC8_9MICC|nr:serine hydrolase domain-containing protein [Arthrobacter cavernae]MBO1268664.1 beta-lactamase family protein [Arthrobacter cavernae]